MKPLHDHLFDILRSIITDGTFDQLRPVTRLVDRCSALGIKNVYSYDLSAATDRLPIWLQMSILESILGVKGAAFWKTILVGRPYFVKGKGAEKYLGEPIFYKVGQPMGALSS